MSTLVKNLVTGFLMARLIYADVCQRSNLNVSKCIITCMFQRQEFTKFSTDQVLIGCKGFLGMIKQTSSKDPVDNL